MALQTKLIVLEKLIQIKIPQPKFDKKPLIRLYMDLVIQDVKPTFKVSKDTNRFIIPDNMKVRHADWEYFYSFAERQRKYGEKYYQEHIKFCNEMRETIDTVNGWID